MRAFHELVFNEWMVGNGLVFSAWPAWLLLGAVDSLKIFVSVDSVEGSSPALELLLSDSCDGVYYNNLKTLFAGEPLSPTSVTLLRAIYTPVDAQSPSSHGVGFLTQLSGADPKAHIRIWVTGRLN